MTTLEQTEDISSKSIIDLENIYNILKNEIILENSIKTNYDLVELDKIQKKYDVCKDIFANTSEYKNALIRKINDIEQEKE